MRMLSGVVGLLMVLWPMMACSSDLTELEKIVDDARLSFARFVAHPDLTWFRERARNARAVFIAPRVKRASFLFGGHWGTGVLLVRDRATGQWSEPAFYTLVGPSFGLQVGALRSEIVALATDDHAAAEMMDGAFTLGINAALGAGRMGGGISGSLEVTSGTSFVSVATTTGLYAGIALGATLVLSKDGANALYYGQPVELSDLREGRVRQWYSERLMRAVANVTANGQELSP